MALDYSLGTSSGTDPAPADTLHLAEDLFGDVEREAPFSAAERPRTTLRPSAMHSVRPSFVPRPGDTLLNKYRIEQIRGETANEVVLFAIHLELGQRVILRLLTPQASEQPELAQNFQRAARKAMDVRSEHGERVMDFGRLDSGCLYRVAELPRGPSLVEIMQVRGPLPVEEAVDIVVGVAEAVAESVATRSPRRTLSASDLFVERRPDGAPWVRIVELGALEQSAASQADTLHGQELSLPAARGFLPYTAPEQLRHPASVDVRADVWALGAICYELLAGRPPFQAESSIALLAMIAADAPQPLSVVVPHAPPVLEELVLACLNKDPVQRPSSVADLVSQLAPFGSPHSHDIASRIVRLSTRSLRPSQPTSAPPSAHFGWQGVSNFPSRSSSHPAPAPSAPPHGYASVHASMVPASMVPQANTQQSWFALLGVMGLSVAAAVITTLLLTRDRLDEPTAERTGVASQPAASGAMLERSTEPGVVSETALPARTAQPGLQAPQSGVRAVNPVPAPAAVVKARPVKDKDPTAPRDESSSAPASGVRVDTPGNVETSGNGESALLAREPNGQGALFNDVE
jgi:serine/threonine-protein kinase